jgi:hypothetical protein
MLKTFGDFSGTLERVGNFTNNIMGISLSI